MKSNITKYVLVLIFFCALAAVVFRCGWGTERVFSGSDANIGLIARSHRGLPDSLFGAYTPTPVFGAAKQGGLPTVRALGLWLLPPSVFSDAWYGFYLVLSSLFLVGYLRLWNLRWPACMFGATAAFWVGSATLSAAGHITKLGVMMLFTLALLLVERAVRSATAVRRIGWACGAGFAVGWMLLEQQDVALFAGIFLGAYALFRLFQTAWRNSANWAGVLVPIACIGLLVAASASLKSYRASVTDTGMKKDPQAQWDFVTQWSMVPAELPDLVAPGYTGWSSGNPDGPYWGKVGQSPDWDTTRQGFRNFRLDSVYVGVLPVALALLGLAYVWQRRQADRETAGVVICWAALACLALLLSFGKYSPVYRVFYHLPLVGNIRAPIKFLHNFQVIAAVLAAFGLDRLMRKEEGFKALAITLSALTALLVLFALGDDTARFTDEWGQQAKIIAGNIRSGWLHAAALLAVLSGGVACLWKWPGKATATWCGACFVAVAAVDAALLTRHYFKCDNIAYLQEGNPVIDYLKQNQGDERIYLTNQSGVYGRWVAVEGAYHGLNLFNIWQMPRMPSEYKQLFSAVQGCKDPTRLWQLASVKYVTAAAGFPAALKGSPLESRFKPIMYYRFVMQGDQIAVQVIDKPGHQNDQVLLEHSACIPRFAVFHHWTPLPAAEHAARLFSPSFDPLASVLVDMDADALAPPGGNGFDAIAADTTLHDAAVQTDLDQPGVLLFTQRFQPQWRATIDGEPAEIIQCNHVCMGVFVPAGQHEVVFTCR